MLENVYKIEWIAKKAHYALLLGITYSILGIATAIFLFPKDPGIVAIAFTSLIILPSLNKLLILEENREARHQKFDLWELFREHRDVIKVYLFLFLGIMFTFSFFAIVWPSIATSTIFSEQIRVIGQVGNAVSPAFTFQSVFSNNAKVLLIVLLASFIYGSGAIFIITWNASVWGTVLGVIVKNAAILGDQNPFLYFAITFVAILPHLLAEATGYFLGAVAGGVISTAALREKLFSKRFQMIIYDSLIFFVMAVVLVALGAYIEVFATGTVVNLLGL